MNLIRNGVHVCVCVCGNLHVLTHAVANPSVFDNVVTMQGSDGVNLFLEVFQV